MYQSGGLIAEFGCCCPAILSVEMEREFVSVSGWGLVDVSGRRYG